MISIEEMVKLGEIKEGSNLKIILDKAAEFYPKGCVRDIGGEKTLEGRGYYVNYAASGQPGSEIQGELVFIKEVGDPALIITTTRGGMYIEQTAIYSISTISE